MRVLEKVEEALRKKHDTRIDGYTLQALRVLALTTPIYGHATTVWRLNLRPQLKREEPRCRPSPFC